MSFVTTTHHTFLCRPGGGAVHRAAKLATGRLVPLCQIVSAKRWHVLPGNVTVTCKRCAARLRGEERGPRQAPRGIYPGEHSYAASKTNVRYKATGEYRAPKRWEFYLSGAIICAYRALTDLDAPYWIAVAGRITTTTTTTREKT